MKTLFSALAAHLAAECSTLAYLVKLTRTDGAVFAFTSHDADLIIDGVTYQADGAFNPSALLSGAALAADNLSLTGMVSAAAVTDADLRAGRYDRARCDVYLCNWADLSQGVLQLRRGWLGEVKLQGGQYTAALHGLHDRLQYGIGDYYTALCRHDLGDTACGVNLAAYTVTGAVTAVLDATHFSAGALSNPGGWFNYGKLTWTGGLNSGLACEVQTWDAPLHQFALWLPLPNAPQAGDTFQVQAGCDKRFSTCKSKFANQLNFGGFPHLPGVDRLLQYPDSKA